MNRAFIVAGLGYGDEGKGATVDYLCHKYDANLVVRYNGGSQAAHNVVTPDGTHHPFQQFGAGTFLGIKTHLSKYMLINPMNMMLEEERLRQLGITNAWAWTTVDPRALIITPYHRELNRYLTVGHNSCGLGIGVCREFSIKYGERVLFANNLRKEAIAKEKLRFIRDRAIEWALRWKHAHPEWLDPPRLLYPDDGSTPNNEDFIDSIWQDYTEWPVEFEIFPSWDGTTVFEGAQGVLLDEIHGEEGFNTWTDCTFNNTKMLLGGYVGKIIRVGVTRTYHTRHGEGPFPPEDSMLELLPEPHNSDIGNQGKFRRAQFDANLFRKGLKILKGIDMLAVNHLDQCDWTPPADVANLPRIEGRGPTRNNRILVADDSTQRGVGRTAFRT